MSIPNPTDYIQSNHPFNPTTQHELASTPLTGLFCSHNFAKNNLVVMPSSYAPGFYPAGGFSPEVAPAPAPSKTPFCSALWMQNWGEERDRIEREERLIALTNETAALPPPS